MMPLIVNLYSLSCLLITTYLTIKGFECNPLELNESDEWGRLSPNVLLKRGYKPEQHVVESDGYKLSLVRIINPLIPKPSKGPVLFIHGFRTSGACFIENSAGVTPQDLSYINIEQTSLDDLLRILVGRPESHSMAFLMSNLGYDVWLINMRSTRETILLNQFNINKIGDPKKIDLLSQVVGLIPKFLPIVTQVRASVAQEVETALVSNVKKGYWNYSYDEQAQHDLPRTIDYIVQQTGYQQLRVVCHSAGCGVFMMSMSSVPEYGDKVSHAALYAPAFYLFSDKGYPFAMATISLEPLFVGYDGPVPTIILDQAYSDTIATICRTIHSSMKDAGCSSLSDNVEGPTYGQNNPMSRFYMPTSAKEFTQLVQSINKGRVHQFDFGMLAKNLEVYKQPSPPIYNVSFVRVKKISIWQGNTDSLVMHPDSSQLAKDLPPTTHVEYHFLNHSGIACNHYGYLYNMYNDIYINIPALKSLTS